MIPTSFDYVRAVSLRDALKVLSEGDGSKVIAGGHSLLPIMKFRLAQPPRLVDISRLEELKGIAEKGRGARIGAGTTYRELLESELLRERFPIIAEATETIGDLQVRNRGTIGGSLAHADPVSDMPAVMLALDATFNLRSKGGRRSVKAREFFQGAFTTALAEDELLTEIILPPVPTGAGTTYLSQENPASGYALVAAAVVVARKRKAITHAVVALTGVGEMAYLLRSADGLVGSNGEPDVVARVAAEATTGVEVNGDIHAPAGYRRHLATVITRRALETALERAG
ncbi:MAG: aerobic carbon-monoxide dehydrogenase medium subunit [Gemmatimonadales bacterium]|jgi:carbon-monoxide dehydrogenase medium subunit|nr:aerobic carbon-monoxide dehydrogenase medium subunit [Gemmatimonadales bacterium]